MWWGEIQAAPISLLLMIKYEGRQFCVWTPTLLLSRIRVNSPECLCGFITLWVELGFCGRGWGWNNVWKLSSRSCLSQGVCEQSKLKIPFPSYWVRHWFHSDFYFWNYYFILLCTSHHGEGGFSHLTQWEQSQKAPRFLLSLPLLEREWKSGAVGLGAELPECQEPGLTTFLSPWSSLASTTWCRVGISMWW